MKKTHSLCGKWKLSFTEPFEDKIILNENFQITTGFQTLLITYLDYRVENRKDLDLLKVLFHIEAKNPQATKKAYVDKYENFEDFIKKHAN